MPVRYTKAPLVPSSADSVMLPVAVPRGAAALLLVCSALACTAGDTGRAPADSAVRGSTPADSVRTATPPDSATADTSRASGDSAKVVQPGQTSGERAVPVNPPPDSLRYESVPGSAAPAVRDSAAAGSAAAPTRATIEWPAPPAPLPGALLPANRIVAYYGNPLSRRMGILGELPPVQMMERLEQTAAEWQKADTTVKVLPALHLIATVAQGKPGPEKMYRLRMSDSIIERVAGWAEQKGWLLFLDIQPGHSTVEKELPHLLDYLKRPYVHLALDPEFAMTGRGDGALPGRKIGTLDAREINWAIDTVAKLVTAYNLPPKVLVIHRFTERMITNYDEIRRDPRVQVVIDMDGFGAPSLKKSTWRYVIRREPVQYTGVKLFYKNDKPLLSPRQTLDAFKPEPVYIQYQ